MYIMKDLDIVVKNRNLLVLVTDLDAFKPIIIINLLRSQLVAQELFLISISQKTEIVKNHKYNN